MVAMVALARPEALADQVAMVVSVAITAMAVRAAMRVLVLLAPMPELQQQLHLVR